MIENDTYLVRGEDGAEYGPVALSELREWAGENRVGLGTDVRRDMPDGAWHPWQFYPELVALLAEVNVTGLPAAVPVLAPYGRRILAGLADLVFSSIISTAAITLSSLFIPTDLIAKVQQVDEQILTGTLSSTMPPEVMNLGVLLFALSLLVQLIYYAGFHATCGRTPAKTLMHIQVVDSSGQKPSFLRALIRGMIFMVSLGMSGIPLLFVFFHPQRRGLHDLAAGTYVVEL